jgi:phenylacetic acid degradation protein paaN
MSLYEKHAALLHQAVLANKERTFFAAYPENPKAYGENAMAEGLSKFQALLNTDFNELLQTNPLRFEGEEVSPYLQTGLGIRYPVFADKVVVQAASLKKHAWQNCSIDDRAGILIEALDRMKARFFEIAYATMHTTGQAFMMSFQASGPHAADRALEAIAMGYEELKRFPGAVTWVKPMGRFDLSVNKTWRAVSKGVGLVIGCSTFPTWNTVPGMFANLICGNTCIVKPHPKAVLPIAIVVAELQKVLVENGYSANICQLSVDTLAFPLTKEYAQHPDVSLIDYTGNSVFGNWLETLSVFGKTVFTEKAGVNSIIIDSMPNLKKGMDNIAFSICLYSGQMCTAPQNIFIPESGINTDEGHKTFDEVAQALVDSINGITQNPKMAAGVLGAIQNDNTLQRIKESSSLPDTTVLLSSQSIDNAEFPNARTATPMILVTSSSNKPGFSKELFGPIALIIKTNGIDESVRLAKQLAKEHGAISCGAYALNKETRELIADAMADAFTPVSFNLDGGLFVNQNAAFSDFHVTGGNPAGNASFTDPSYINRRFVWVGQRNI